MFGPLIVKPGTSTETKTGAWRTETRPKFLHKDCVGCRLCVLICPEGCVSGKEKNAFECDLNYCKGCAGCAQVCPKKDVIMVKEEVGQ